MYTIKAKLLPTGYIINLKGPDTPLTRELAKAIEKVVARNGRR
jgi:hypothetical protein